MTRELAEKIIGYAICAGLIAIHLAFGSVALVRALGVVLAISGSYSFFLGRIPYRIKGREPSGYFTGGTARFLAVAFVVLGVVLAAAATKATCILGWAQPGSCA